MKINKIFEVNDLAKHENIEETTYFAETDYISILTKIAFANSNFRYCESLCHCWIERDPNNLTCLLTLANVYIKLKKLDKAVSICQIAIKHHQNSYEAFLLMADILKEKSLFKEAIRFYNQTIYLNPSCIGAYVNLATLYLLSGNLDNAIKPFSSALRLNPSLYQIRIDLGNIYKALGKIEESKNCYLQTIETNPDSSIAWNNLGCIYAIQQEIWLAIHHFEKAVKIDKNFYDAHVNLGNMFREIKLFERAILSYQNALRIKNTNPILYGNLANIYYERGLYDLSIDLYKRALEIEPNFPDACCNLANALKEQNFIDEAEQYYIMAIKLCDNHSDSYNNLANIKREKGDITEAINLYRRAIEIKSDFAAAHSNLASLLQTQGLLNESLQHYQRAININPNFTDALSNMGNAYKELNNNLASIDCYLKAIEINPFFADAHSNLASVHKDIGNISEAILYYEKSLKLKHDMPDSFCNLVHCFLIICKWDNYDVLVNKVVEIVCNQLKNNKHISVHPHHSMLYPFDPMINIQIAKCYSNLAYNKIKHKIIDPISNRNNTHHHRIKIGYVSSDFCNHPTAHLMQSVPGWHNRSKYEIYCYALNCGDNSSYWHKINSESEHFVDLSQISSNDLIYERIYSDKIDILINMNGYTKGARNEIFALRPASIQVLWLGYPNTMGSEFIDYIISDPTTTPIGQEYRYSEKIARMPETFFLGDHFNMFPHLIYDQTYDKRNISILSMFKIPDNVNSYLPDKILVDKMIDTRVEELRSYNSFGENIPVLSNILIKRSFYGIPDDVFVYCNFNQLYKLNPATLESWIKILKQTTNTVLWLLKFPKSGEENIRNYLKLSGLHQDRIIFTNVAPKEEHVRRGQLADLCLDTPLCNGHTTSMDILWAGCPLITLPSHTFASRVASSLLKTINCPELIVHSYIEYENLAIELSINKEKYHRIKATVWYGRFNSNLFNVKKYVENLEKIYDNMIEIYRSKKSPQDININ